MTLAREELEARAMRAFSWALAADGDRIGTNGGWMRVTVSQVEMDLEAIEVPVVEPMAGDPGKDRTGVDPEIVAKARAVEMARAKAGPKEIMAMLRAAGVEIPKTMRSNLKRWYIPRWEKEPEIAAMIGKTDTVNSTKAV